MFPRHSSNAGQTRLPRSPLRLAGSARPRKSLGEVQTVDSTARLINDHSVAAPRGRDKPAIIGCVERHEGIRGAAAGGKFSAPSHCTVRSHLEQVLNPTCSCRRIEEQDRTREIQLKHPDHGEIVRADCQNCPGLTRYLQPSISDSKSGMLRHLRRSPGPKDEKGMRFNSSACGQPPGRPNAGPA